MPPPDPQFLRSLQSSAARARLVLDETDRGLAKAAADLRSAETRLARAEARGDRAAAENAKRAIEAGIAAREAARARRGEVHGELSEILDTLRDVDLDAPGDTPLLLLPIRLETRFADNGRTLRIRIYPDEIHLDALDRGLTPGERAAGQGYWSALWAAGDEAATEPAWATLTHAVGADRAVWVARAMTPTNPAARAGGGAPAFPEPAEAHRTAAVARLLPERFFVAAEQGRQIVRGHGQAVAPEVRVGLLSDDEELVDQAGLKMLPGTEWLADYDKALAAGLAITLALPSAQPIRRLLVYGVNQSRTAAQSAAEFERLLEAHWCTRGLAFVPQGTPTNNVETARAGWQKRIEPAPLPLTMPAEHPESNGARLADALGLGADWFGLLGGAAGREEGAARAMNGALWPATWGYFLETLDQNDAALSPVIVDDARRFHAENVRGRGPLPALRVGNQPYGVLPVWPLATAAAAGRFETGLKDLLGTALRTARAAVPGLPRVQAGADAETLLDVFRLAPVSLGIRARKAVSDNMTAIIGSLTGTAREKAEIESLLTELVAQTFGGPRSRFGAGSLDKDAHPVALPYADPERDAAFVRALLEGGATGGVSSVFQALLIIGWTRARKDVDRGPKVLDVIGEVAGIAPAVRERMVGLLSRPEAPPDALRAALAELPGSGEPEARPSLLSVKKLVGSDATFADFAAEATSAPERAHFAGLAVDHAFRMSSRLSELRQAMRDLLDATEAEKPDFGTLVAEMLDTASHRVDAWVTALATSRLRAVRRDAPGGVSVGAFGWVEDLRPERRNRTEGGFVAAPSLAHATTAGILRSAYLNHDGTDGRSPFAIDLSSARVRQAMVLIDGVRNGQPLGALLGYGFERALHEAGCDRFVLTLRGIAPLRQGFLNDAGEAVPQEAAERTAATNVVDFLRLLDRYDAGPDAIRARLVPAPAGNDYLDPALWQPPTDAEWNSIRNAVEAGRAAADAVADLMLAESVHQLAGGNSRRASAALDAAGKGEAPPPEPDFVSTVTPGVVVTHRTLAIAPAAGAWSAGTPRALASTGIERWLGTRLGDPAAIVVGFDADGTALTLRDAGLGAYDFVLESADPAALERRLRAALPSLTGEMAVEDPRLGGNTAVTDAILAADALRVLLELSRPIDVLSLGLPGVGGWQPQPGAADARLATLATLEALLETRLDRLADILSAEAVSREALTTALLDLAGFGIVLPDIGTDNGASLAFLALDEGRARLARATAARAASGASAGTPEVAEAVARALFGREFLLPVPVVFAPPTAEVRNGARPFAPLAPGEVERFLADAGAVRRPVGAVNKAALLTRALGRASAWEVVQICGPGERLPDHWIGRGVPASEPTPTAPVVSLVADAPDGLDLGEPIEGFLIDEWTEVMAKRERRGEQPDAPVDNRITAGVAVHADAPNAQPPQAMLLALSPDGGRWTEERIEALLGEVLDLAQARLVTLETLPLAGRVLPAIYTQSVSLQGEPVLDLSKIRISAAELVRSPELRHFTMTRNP